MRKLPECVTDPVFQYADDITNSTASDCLHKIQQNLEDNFMKINEFCQDRDLRINTEKTQCILLKLPSKKTPKELELILDSHIIKAATTVELLGLTIDQHLSFKQHIEKTVNKCHGLIGVIRKAKHILPLSLLKLSYTALVRPHLENCSLTFASASKTNLAKLETVQKIASRIICGEKRDAHSEPLLRRLGLSTLKERREMKIIKTVNNIVENQCHPYLSDMLFIDSDGLLTNNETDRISFGRKRFSSYAKHLYNN